MEIDFRVWDIGLIECIEDFLTYRVDIDTSNFDFIEALFETGQVVIEGENVGVIASNDLVNAISEECSSVEVGRIEVCVWYNLIAYHCQLHRNLPFESANLGRFYRYIRHGGRKRCNFSFTWVLEVCIIHGLTLF